MMPDGTKVSGAWGVPPYIKAKKGASYKDEGQRHLELSRLTNSIDEPRFAETAAAVPGQKGGIAATRG